MTIVKNKVKYKNNQPKTSCIQTKTLQHKTKPNSLEDSQCLQRTMVPLLD